MGLDITAYKNLKPATGITMTEDGEPLRGEKYAFDLAVFYANPDFPGREGSIKEGVAYEYEDAHGFRAGAYSFYFRWRDWLAKLAGYPAVDATLSIGIKASSHAASAWHGHKGPFYELINFADNEGTLGPEVAARLLADFREWDERAKTFAESSEPRMYDMYQEFTKAMEYASENGAVQFH